MQIYMECRAADLLFQTLVWWNKCTIIDRIQSLTTLISNLESCTLPLSFSLLFAHFPIFFFSFSIYTRLSPYSSWKSAAGHPLPAPNHLTQCLYPTSIFFLFSMWINCSALYSGINSWNTATVNNLLSVWEKPPGSGNLQQLEVTAASCGSLSIVALKESSD